MAVIQKEDITDLTKENGQHSERQQYIRCVFVCEYAQVCIAALL